MLYIQLLVLSPRTPHLHFYRLGYRSLIDLARSLFISIRHSIIWIDAPLPPME